LHAHDRQSTAVLLCAVLDANETAEAAALVEGITVGELPSLVEAVEVPLATQQLPQRRRLKQELLMEGGGGALADPMAAAAAADISGSLDPNTLLAPGQRGLQLQPQPAEPMLLSTSLHAALLWPPRCKPRNASSHCRLHPSWFNHCVFCFAFLLQGSFSQADAWHRAAC
jgi:hypothetical protein